MLTGKLDARECLGQPTFGIGGRLQLTSRMKLGAVRERRNNSKIKPHGDTMATAYSYACCDCEGMETCPGKVTAATRDEVWKLMELHALIAHGENAADWDDETREYLGSLIKEENS